MKGSEETQLPVWELKQLRQEVDGMHQLNQRLKAEVEEQHKKFSQCFQELQTYKDVVQREAEQTLLLLEQEKLDFQRQLELKDQMIETLRSQQCEILPHVTQKENIKETADWKTKVNELKYQLQGTQNRQQGSCQQEEQRDSPDGSSLEKVTRETSKLTQEATEAIEGQGQLPWKQTRTSDATREEDGDTSGEIPSPVSPARKLQEQLDGSKVAGVLPPKPKVKPKGRPAQHREDYTNWQLQAPDKGPRLKAETPTEEESPEMAPFHVRQKQFERSKPQPPPPRPCGVKPQVTSQVTSQARHDRQRDDYTNWQPLQNKDKLPSGMLTAHQARQEWKKRERAKSPDRNK